MPFVMPDAPSWVEDMVSERALGEAGVFDPVAVRGLWQKCRLRAESGQFSNTDNMAVVGVLSAQLLHHQLVRQPPDCGAPISFRTMVEL
jgi:asparagine synthase (glutamine-hydrolysing)